MEFWSCESTGKENSVVECSMGVPEHHVAVPVLKPQTNWELGWDTDRRECTGEQGVTGTWEVWRKQNSEEQQNKMALTECP